MSMDLLFDSDVRMIATAVLRWQYIVYPVSIVVSNISAVLEISVLVLTITNQSYVERSSLKNAIACMSISNWIGIQLIQSNSQFWKHLLQLDWKHVKRHGYVD